MDYGHVIIHVFFESVRSFYDLEGLWSDARRIPLPASPPKPASAGKTRRPDAAGEEG
jgi:ribosome-associated protein